MILREIYYYFKKNKHMIILLVFQVSIFLILFGTFLSFSSELHYGKTNIEKTYHNKVIYQLLDGYFDPDEFLDFRKKEDSLDILKEYYTKLNTAKSFDYLSMYNQAIGIENTEKISSTISSDTIDPYQKTNAFQLNLMAQNFFDLQTEKGRPFNKGDFVDKDIIPILIGNDLADTLSLGEQLNAFYYNKKVKLEVIGVLTKNTFIYFNGDSEFYLDDYIVMPYVDYGMPSSKDDEEFQKIVYFAMINGYPVTDIGKSNSINVHNELESISQASGFHNYLFLGSNPNIQPYRGLVNIINSNYNLVLQLFAVCFLLNSIIICTQLLFLQTKRLPSLAVHYINGASPQIFVKQFFCEIGLIFFLGYIISGIILNKFLKITDIPGNIILFFTALTLSICASILPIFKLYKTELILLLNREEKHIQ